jgi:proline iminopeptidase
MELRVNGTTLDAETVGEGPPCLVLHGGPGTDSSGLRAGLRDLAGRLGLQLVFYDHRGHGRSKWGPVEECTHDQLVADVEGVRTALGLGPVHVLGVSWGGFIALPYAARYPASLRRLVVVGAAASHEFMAQAEANARRDGTPAQWTAYRALWDGSLPDDDAFRRAFDAIAPLYYHDKTRAAAGRPAGATTRYRLAVRKFVLAREFPRYDARPELGRIRCPTLVLVGRHDWICPVPQAEEIQRRVPGARLVVFERSGHSPHVEERERFVEEVARFLGEAPA